MEIRYVQGKIIPEESDYKKTFKECDNCRRKSIPEEINSNKRQTSIAKNFPLGIQRYKFLRERMFQTKLKTRISTATNILEDVQGERLPHEIRLQKTFKERDLRHKRAFLQRKDDLQKSSVLANIVIDLNNLRSSK